MAVTRVQGHLHLSPVIDIWGECVQYVYVCSRTKLGYNTHSRECMYEVYVVYVVYVGVCVYMAI